MYAKFSLFLLRDLQDTKNIDMAKWTIVALPGDGIGAIVLEQAVRVLDAAGFDAEYIYGDIGWEFWRKEGNPLPERTLELIEKHKIALFGAITSKPNEEAKAELDPSLQGKGFIYSSPIVGLRQHFNLDICVRPCKSYKGNPLNFIRRGRGNTIEEPLVDVVIFRQNTECLVFRCRMDKSSGKCLPGVSIASEIQSEFRQGTCE